MAFWPLPSLGSTEHPIFTQPSSAVKSPDIVSTLVNRAAIGFLPSSKWIRLMKDSLGNVASRGLKEVFTAQSVSEAREFAYKVSFMYYRRL
ncbi:hypothetical protein CEP54_016073, partial [Fusarium duplospermum]